MGEKGESAGKKTKIDNGKGGKEEAIKTKWGDGIDVGKRGKRAKWRNECM